MVKDNLRSYLLNLEAEKTKNLVPAIEAMERFMELAEGFTGQSKYARIILFSMYDCSSFSMTAGDLMPFDYCHADDAITILAQHSRGYKSLFKFIENGEKRIEKLVARYA